MLANNDGVDAAAVHPEVAAQQIFEPGGVQYGARADDLVGRKAGKPLGGQGQNIYRVGDHQQDGLLGILYDLRNDGAENAYVFLYQVQPGLSRLLIGPGGDDHQGAVCKVGIVPGVNFHGPGEGQTVGDVHGLPLGFGTVDVDKDHFGKNTGAHHGVGGGGAYEATADNGGFLNVDHRQDPFQ